MALLFHLTQKPAHGFPAFWVRWPRKVDRIGAEKAWCKVVKPTDEPLIHAALDWQIPIFEAREPEHIPHAQTWINRRRWEDEPPTPKRNPVTARVTPEQTQQQVAVSKIHALMNQGMDREQAKRTVYRELGWIKE